MPHQLVRDDADIMNHLHGFCVLQPNMLFLTSILVKEVMDQLSEGSPLVAVAHDQQVVSMGHQIVRDIRKGPIAVNSTFLVNQRFDYAPVADHHSCRRTHL